MSEELDSWNKLILSALSDGDTFEELVWTISPELRAKEFDSGYGGTEGPAFTAWGKTNVYFPICYDGAEWVGHAPRNPCDVSLEHQGGG